MSTEHEATATDYRLSGCWHLIDYGWDGDDGHRHDFTKPCGVMEYQHDSGVYAAPEDHPFVASPWPARATMLAALEGLVNLMKTKTDHDDETRTILSLLFSRGIEDMELISDFVAARDVAAAAIAAGRKPA